MLLLLIYVLMSLITLYVSFSFLISWMGTKGQVALTIFALGLYKLARGLHWVQLLNLRHREEDPNIRSTSAWTV
jgi:uncharacterized membrane protein